MVEIIYLPDTHAAPEEAAVDKASWKKYNVVSALVIPLSTGGGKPLGFWGIDSTSERREWPERLQKRLRIIAGVFANTIERAVSDRLLLESEARLTLAAETAGAGFWTIDEETGDIWATPKLKELFGLKPDDAVDMTTFLATVHPEDRESMQQAINAMTRGEERKEEYRIVPASGPMRWVMSRGGRRVFTVDGRSMLMGITFDITERRRSEEALRTLGGRLIKAQEQERARIAGELHDDIGQRLALLAFQLQQLQEGTLILPEVRSRIGEFEKQISEIATDIQSLSHELDSTKLQYLGIAAAMRGFCREFAEQMKVEIDFDAHDLPSPFSPDISLCLFRVLQEALHNSAKHSGVRQFEVRLSGTSDEIHLTVKDSGAGFDREAAKESRGLGLISMEERLKLVKGTLSIESQPKRGTTIHARVPFDSGSDSMRAAG